MQRLLPKVVNEISLIDYDNFFSYILLSLIVVSFLLLFFPLIRYLQIYLNSLQLNFKSGFTLIELLVVIAIIAVLAVMGFAAFGGLTGRGNDSRRKADIKAFADAMEVKRGTGGVYVTVAVTDLAAGAFPSEPTSRTEKYCYTDGTAAIANPTLAQWVTTPTSTACPTAGSGNGTAWMNVSAAAPTVSATATFFKFCTYDQAKAVIFCVGSRQ